MHVCVHMREKNELLDLYIWSECMLLFTENNFEPSTLSQQYAQNLEYKKKGFDWKKLILIVFY